ncbi:MarR family winged helix-turn-helix transcriptional regulator [Microbacterium sp. MYb62]|uniref:MarR family winged helix-turn-helix transcriptional regulator n=1 Tax=Microbacterium sp. MYb62 TaxID=1848690 RepID=UPI000CFBE398|nr:MarR family transcriptional regulator [Microbacterium sp. MYb62]PRB08245.1 MarR family transcriptional regulator [Microbacterium sp. MYb62]
MATGETTKASATTADTDVPRGFLHPLAQLTSLVTSRVLTLAEQNGLTPTQARILGLLLDGPQRMATIAQGLDIEKTALTGLIDRAEAKGLVERTAVPHDRRATNVTATPAGEAAARTFYAQLNDTLEALIAELPPRDREAFRAYTATIAGSVAEVCPNV